VPAPDTRHPLEEYFSSASVREQMGLTAVNEYLSRLQNSLFRHITFLDECQDPANKALQLMAELADGLWPE